MGRRCTVQGCNRDKEIPCEGKKTYGIPAIRKSEEAITTRRQNLWLKRLNLFGKKHSIKNVWVCDAHFLSGKPSYYMDERNPDWAPSQNIGSINFVSKSVYERYKRRKKFQAMRVTAKTTECSLKQKVSYRICHPASTVSSPSTHASSNTSGLLSKEIEVDEKMITHQMPGVSKQKEELLEVLQSQPDILWIDKLPGGNTSQTYFGENIKRKIHPSNVAHNAQASKSNDKGREAPPEKIENEKNGMNQKQGEKNNQELNPTILSAPTIFSQQMMRNNRILFISSNTMHDHDYCAKPICVNDLSENALVQRCSIDHDYCLTLPLYGPPFTDGSDSNSRHIPPLAEAPIQNSREEANIDGDGQAGRESHLESIAATDAALDFILPDVAREDNGSVCNLCAQGVSSLKLDLERKSATLEQRMNDLNSLKQELELAREHIDNLRAQLEVTTHTLCSYYSKDEKSS